MNSSYRTALSSRRSGQQNAPVVARPVVTTLSNNQAYFPEDMVRVSWQGTTLEARGANGQLLTLGAFLLLVGGAIALANSD